MHLVAGTRLGQYEVLGPIGAGGMGEVYKARDTRLARDVALETLPDTFTHDPERLARLRREAQVLAALNHPNIGSIYGFEETGASVSSFSTPDGRRIIFTSDRDGRLNLYVQSADGSGAVERLTSGDTTHWATSITPDGRVVGQEFGATTSFDLFVAPCPNRATRTDGTAGVVRPQPLLRDPLAQSAGEVSPNGRYLVYESNDPDDSKFMCVRFPM